MAEKKTTLSSSKAPKKKPLLKKTATTQPAPAPRKTRTSKISVKPPTSKEISQSSSVSKAFSTGNLSAPLHHPAPKADKKVPNRMILFFIFSIVFFFFSLYKAFIYGKGYELSEQLGLPLGEQAPEVLGIDTPLPQQETGAQLPLVPESGIVNGDELLNDTKLIQEFYGYLTNNQIAEMNALVDRPLKNSLTRTNHWNKKNIQIFTKNLANTVLLQDIFLIPGSVDSGKNTRQYSYTLQYTIQPEHSFNEERQITLLTHGEKTFISEIMCKTEGCSHSPFFWPQNYNLK